jgi:glycosyltransferase involved in cell wall biosynthesis
MPWRTFIIVAARDEADRVGATLAALALAFPEAKMWVADDGSHDATGEVADKSGARVVRSPRPIGKGGAVTVAACEALLDARASGPGGVQEAVFVLCDGDLGSSAAELRRLVEPVCDGQADLAVAAFRRRVGGGFGIAVAFARWAIRRCCGYEASAPISGQRALSGGALEDVLPFAQGFGMEVGMTIDAVRAGHRVLELELDLAHRATGRSLAGFAHRGRQLGDSARVYLNRRRAAPARAPRC